MHSEHSLLLIISPQPQVEAVLPVARRSTSGSQVSMRKLGNFVVGSPRPKRQQRRRSRRPSSTELASHGYLCCRLAAVVAADYNFIYLAAHGEQRLWWWLQHFQCCPIGASRNGAAFTTCSSYLFESRSAVSSQLALSLGQVKAFSGLLGLAGCRSPAGRGRVSRISRLVHVVGRRCAPMVRLAQDSHHD